MRPTSTIIPLCLFLCACGDSTGGGSGGGTASGTDTETDSTTTTTVGTTDTSPATSEPSTSTSDTTSTTTTDDTGSTGAECECQATEVCTPDGCRGGYIFINFDGPTLIEGETDDASMDQTSIMQLVGPTEPYGGTRQDRTDLLTGVRALFDGISVYVTDERPPEGPYSMIVLGPNLDPFMGALEISTLDCGNAVPSSVSFAGIEAGDALTLAQHVTIVAHAAGHGAGLEHVMDNGAVMWQMLATDPSFQNSCIPLMNGMCTEHEAHCPAGEQDSFAELTAIYGAL